ncbi:MAG: hypothetical protein Q8S44_10540 [Flavobacteriaceae bacterium]|nr:hypothetical protein [Flavobacteriaceae bacterium]
MELKLKWTEFKNICSIIFYLNIQYIEADYSYLIYINDSFNQYVCHVDKTTPPSSDQTDFETNYKSNANTFAVLSKAIDYDPTEVGDQATPVVAEVPGRKIRVLSFAVSTSINGPIVYLRDGIGGTQISEKILNAISGSTVPINYQRTAYYPIYLFQTSPGNPLICNCSATGSASVQVVYVLI